MKTITSVDFKRWAEEFLAARCEPLDEEHLDWFATGVKADLVHMPLPTPLPDQIMSVRILRDRGAKIGLHMTPYALMTIAGLDFTERPAIPVMWTYALRYWQLKHNDQKIDMLELRIIFPNGFPPEEELHRLWELQKEGGANMLDRIDPNKEVEIV